ncbi:MAG: hypothetical protein QF662_05040, partial [Phycisphaerae bacterium]|nr:hypothetical protein [Phycisphaerae bacterium]
MAGGLERNSENRKVKGARILTLIFHSSYLAILTSNRRGAMLQKAICEEGEFSVIGGKELQRWHIRPDFEKRIPNV